MSEQVDQINQKPDVRQMDAGAYKQHRAATLAALRQTDRRDREKRAGENVSRKYAREQR